MNHLDILFLILTGYFIYVGYKRGFIKSVRIFVSIIGGAIFSYMLSESTIGILYPGTFKNEFTAKAVLFAAYFILFNFASFYLQQSLTKLFAKVKVVWLDQALGVLFGFLKACFLVFVFVSFTVFADWKPMKQTIVSSVFVKKIYFMVRDTTQINLAQKLKKMNQARNDG